MKTNETKLLSIALGLIVLSAVLVMLALSTLSGQAQSEDEGYPAPIDFGYPINEPTFESFCYESDSGYPICVESSICYMDDIDGYPFPYSCVVSEYQDVVSEPTELQAEIEEVREVIENIQPFEKSKVYQTWQQIKEIVKVYFGKMIMFAR